MSPPRTARARCAEVVAREWICAARAGNDLRHDALSRRRRCSVGAGARDGGGRRGRRPRRRPRRRDRRHDPRLFRDPSSNKQIDFASCPALCAGAAGGRICARAPGAFGGAVSMPPDARVRAVGGALLHV